MSLVNTTIAALTTTSNASYSDAALSASLTAGLSALPGLGSVTVVVTSVVAGSRRLLLSAPVFHVNVSIVPAAYPAPAPTRAETLAAVSFFEGYTGYGVVFNATFVSGTFHVEMSAATQVRSASGGRGAAGA